MHRAVDGRNEVITATDAAPGDVNEAHLMLPLLDKHQETTGMKVETVVADSKYGTINNFLACHDRSVHAHIPDLREASLKRTAKLNIFPEERFQYDAATDTYLCPAGNRLKSKTLHSRRQSRDYAAPKKVCAVCPLREQCTKNKSGRTLKRHLRQEELDAMREKSRSAKSKQDIRTRQHLMERSFANATRFGFDHARWRGLWNMKIQEYLTCAIQNIQILIRYGSRPQKAVAARVKAVQIATSMTKPAIISLLKAVLRPLRSNLELFFKEHESAKQRVELGSLITKLIARFNKNAFGQQAV